MSNAVNPTESDYRRIARVALGDVLHRAARRFGGRKALVAGEESLTFGALDSKSNQMAHSFASLGLQSGDRVAMLCDNSMEMVVAMFGVYKAGLVWVPINTALSVDAIGYILEHAEARHLVIDSALLERPGLRELVEAPRVQLTVIGASDPSTLPSTEARQSGHPTGLPPCDIQGTDLVQIMYTSGTTGRQKGVMHSHASIQSVLMSNLVEWEMGTVDDVYSCHLPLFHVGQHVTTMTALMSGAMSVVMRGFESGQVLEAIARHRITLVVGLPMMYRAMLESEKRASTDLSSLRLCIYAMAPMSKTLLLRLIAEFCPRFALCSGQTEMYTAATIFRPEQQLKRFGAYWGVSVLANEMAVMDESGTLLGPGEIGEVVYRGPNVMLGYYKDPEATAQSRRFGWHHSGDLGQWDDDGELLFFDRMKDMIKTGGENVPSIKVEEVLLRHPAVRNVAVVGLPHRRWGEAITAFVVLDPAADEEILKEVEAHCRQHLGNFEVPKAFVAIASIPQTSTGKVQKYELRQRNLAHFGDTE